MFSSVPRPSKDTSDKLSFTGAIVVIHLAESLQRSVGFPVAVPMWKWLLSESVLFLSMTCCFCQFTPAAFD